MSDKFRYKKYFGQNFLHDTVKIERMIAAVNPQPGDTFLEVGPGSGNLTKKLAPLVYRLTAVEIDIEAIAKLKAATQGISSLEIMHADFMETDIKNFIPAEGKLRIIGNIPYYITTPIIEKAIQNRALIQDLYFTTQREVADRITSEEGSKIYGSLSVFCQFYADCEKLFNIGRKAFFPMPDVDSAFIKMDFSKKEPFNVKSEEVFFKLSRGGFEQRRKMLNNNIKRVFGFTDELARASLREAGLAENARAEDVSILGFAKLADIIYNTLNK
jgi:16S rRNA (adenine1518-N6/adenine1519-N6)-dimethyltransferase